MKPPSRKDSRKFARVKSRMEFIPRSYSSGSILARAVLPIDAPRMTSICSPYLEEGYATRTKVGRGVRT